MTDLRDPPRPSEPESTANGVVQAASLFFKKSGVSATQLGQQVVGCLRSSVTKIIDGCELAYQGIRSFDGDREQVDAFMGVLVAHRMVPRSEKDLGLSSPKLCNILAVGEHADVLRRHEIRDYFLENDCCGISLLYPLVVAYRRYPGSDDERYAKLVETLHTAKPKSRNDFIEVSKSAKKDARSREHAPAPFSLPVREVDLLAASLREREDLDRLRVFDQDPPAILRLGERLADDAAAVIIAPLREIGMVENRLLSSWGMSALQVLLVQPPNTPVITDALAIVVGAKKGKQATSATNAAWSDVTDVGILELAARFFPEAETKLHVLAEESTDGWDAMIAEANWSVADE